MTDDDLASDLERILFGRTPAGLGPSRAGAASGGGIVPVREAFPRGVGDPVPMPVNFARPEPLVGMPAGEQSGTMLGISAAPPPFYSAANIFEDAQLDTAQTTGLFPLAAATSRISAEWWGNYSLTSGVVPADNGWNFLARGQALNNTNSGRMRFRLTAGTASLDSRMIGPGATGRILSSQQRAFPFVVGAVRALHGNIPAGTTAMVMTLELWKNYPGGSVIHSRSLDYVHSPASLANDGHHLLRVAGAMSNWGAADTLALVVRLHWAGVPAAAEITFTACNTVIEDATRSFDVAGGPATISDGQTWQYRLTCTQHDVLAFNETVGISAGGNDQVLIGGINPGLGTVLTGSFVTSGVAGPAQFRLHGNVDYHVGTVAQDECWQVELWQGPGNSLDIAWVEPQLHTAFTNEVNPFAPFGRSWPSTTLLRDGHWDFTYNGDGTIATATRSGIAGVATSVIAYSGGRVSSVVTTRNNKVITSTPTYNGAGQVVSLDRVVTPP